MLKLSLATAPVASLMQFGAPRVCLRLCLRHSAIQRDARATFLSMGSSMLATCSAHDRAQHPVDRHAAAPPHALELLRPDGPCRLLQRHVPLLLLRAGRARLALTPAGAGASGHER